MIPPPRAVSIARRRPKAVRSYAAFAALSVIWGSVFLFYKIALRGLSPLPLAAAEATVGAAVVLGAVLLRREALPRAPRLWGHLAVVGVLSEVIPSLCFAWGEQRVSSGLAAVDNAAVPLMTLLAAWILLPEERPTAAKTTGFMVGFAGVLLVLAPWRGGAASTLAGQSLILAGVFSYAVSIPYSRRFLDACGCSALAMTAGQLTVAALVLLLALLPLGSGPVSLTPPVVSAVLVSGLGLGIAFVLYHVLIRSLGATTMSLVDYFAPLIAVTLGILILHESVSWDQWVGAAVVFTGAALAEGRLGQTRTVAREGDRDH